MQKPASTELYRILNLDGKPSEALYVVIDRDAQTGLVSVAEANSVVKDDQGNVISATKKIMQVTTKRLLPPSSDKLATVIEHSDKYSAHCPECGKQFDIATEDCSVECEEHGQFQLHWIGVRPMTTKQAKPKAAKPKPAPKPAKPQKEPKAAKPAPKPAKPAAKPAPHEKVTVDLGVLEELGLLYVKEGVNFDHPGIEVKAYTLLAQHGDSYRKFCFNTYSGGLGKKASQLPVDTYKDPTKGHAVKDLTEEQSALQKKGYKPVQGKKPRN